MEINNKYINARIEELIQNRKDIPKRCPEKRREIAIRQVQGRILELKYLKEILKRKKNDRIL
jgi:hypothetical protein